MTGSQQRLAAPKRASKNHYSSRQLIQQQQQQQAVSSLIPISSDPEFEKVKIIVASSLQRGRESGDQLSSSSSQASTSSGRLTDHTAMLGSSAKTSSQMQREHMALHQQHQAAAAAQRQRQLQQQAAAAAQRQQQHLLAAAANNNNNNAKSLSSSSSGKHLAAADNLTSSSSSDPSTVDELHHFANSGSHNHHTISHNRHNNNNHHHHHNLALSTAAGARAAVAAAAAAAAAAAKSGQSHHSHATGGGRFLLGVLFTLAELLLFVSVFLWLYWSYQHDDGLAWQNDRKQQFNLHAALMLFGFIFLSGQAMLIHRSFQCCNRIYTKIMHTILFVLATSAISLGLILAYTAQENVGPNNKPIMHFYSLHAWCGLTAVGLFVLQFTVGFVSFLILLCCDQATSSFRAALLPIHKTFGLIIFNLAVATCLMGLLQTARSRLSSKLNKIDYHELAEPGIVINAIGVCLILLAILMPYIIRNLDIKRTSAASHSASTSSSSSSFRSEFDRHLNKMSQYDNLRI